MIKLQPIIAWLLLCPISVITGAVSSNNGIQMPCTMASSTPGWDRNAHVAKSKEPSPRTEMSCISSDPNIFDILKETRDNCRGRDYTVKFYLQKDEHYFKLGSVVIDKNLFHEVLMKYSNWALSGEKIDPENEENEIGQDINPRYEPTAVTQPKLGRANGYRHGKRPKNKDNTCDYHNHLNRHSIIDKQIEQDERQRFEAKYEKVSDTDINDNNYVNIKPNYNTKYKQYEAIIPDNRDEVLSPTIVNVLVDNNNNNDDKYSVLSDILKKTRNDNVKYRNFHIEEGEESFVEDINYEHTNDVSDLKISELVDLLMNNNDDILKKETPIIFNFKNKDSNSIEPGVINTFHTEDAAHYETDIDHLNDNDNPVFDSENIYETAPSTFQYKTIELEPCEYHISDTSDTVDDNANYIITDHEIDDSNHYTFDLTNGHIDPKILTYDFFNPNAYVDILANNVQVAKPTQKMAAYGDISQIQPMKPTPIAKFPNSNIFTPIVEKALPLSLQPSGANLIPFPKITPLKVPICSLSDLPYSTNIPSDTFTLQSLPDLPTAVTPAFKTIPLIEKSQMLPIIKQPPSVKPLIHFLTPSTLETLANDDFRGTSQSESTIGVSNIDVDKKISTLLPEISPILTGSKSAAVTPVPSFFSGTHKSPILSSVSLPELSLTQKPTSIYNMPLSSDISTTANLFPYTKSLPLLSNKYNIPSVPTDVTYVPETLKTSPFTTTLPRTAIPVIFTKPTTNTLLPVETEYMPTLLTNAIPITAPTQANMNLVTPQGKPHYGVPSIVTPLASTPIDSFKKPNIISPELKLQSTLTPLYEDNSFTGIRTTPASIISLTSTKSPFISYPLPATTRQPTEVVSSLNILPESPMFTTSAPRHKSKPFVALPLTSQVLKPFTTVSPQLDSSPEPVVFSYLPSHSVKYQNPKEKTTTPILPISNLSPWTQTYLKPIESSPTLVLPSPSTIATPSPINWQPLPTIPYLPLEASSEMPLIPYSNKKSKNFLVSSSQTPEIVASPSSLYVTPTVVSQSELNQLLQPQGSGTTPEHIVQPPNFSLPKTPNNVTPSEFTEVIPLADTSIAQKAKITAYTPIVEGPSSSYISTPITSSKLTEPFLAPISTTVTPVLDQVSSVSPLLSSAYYSPSKEKVSVSLSDNINTISSSPSYFNPWTNKNFLTPITRPGTNIELSSVLTYASPMQSVSVKPKTTLPTTNIEVIKNTPMSAPIASSPSYLSASHIGPTPIKIEPLITKLKPHKHFAKPTLIEPISPTVWPTSTTVGLPHINDLVEPISTNVWPTSPTLHPLHMKQVVKPTTIEPISQSIWPTSTTVRPLHVKQVVKPTTIEPILPTLWPTPPTVGSPHINDIIEPISPYVWPTSPTLRPLHMKQLVKLTEPIPSTVLPTSIVFPSHIKDLVESISPTASPKYPTASYTTSIPSTHYSSPLLKEEVASVIPIAVPLSPMLSSSTVKSTPIVEEISQPMSPTISPVPSNLQPTTFIEPIPTGPSHSVPCKYVTSNPSSSYTIPLEGQINSQSILPFIRAKEALNPISIPLTSTIINPSFIKEIFQPNPFVKLPETLSSAYSSPKFTLITKPTKISGMSPYYSTPVNEPVSPITVPMSSALPAYNIVKMSPVLPTAIYTSPARLLPTFNDNIQTIYPLSSLPNTPIFTDLPIQSKPLSSIPLSSTCTAPLVTEAIPITYSTGNILPNEPVTSLNINIKESISPVVVSPIVETSPWLKAIKRPSVFSSYNSPMLPYSLASPQSIQTKPILGVPVSPLPVCTSPLLDKALSYPLSYKNPLEDFSSSSTYSPIPTIATGKPLSAVTCKSPLTDSKNSVPTPLITPTFSNSVIESVSPPIISTSPVAYTSPLTIKSLTSSISSIPLHSDILPALTTPISTSPCQATYSSPKTTQSKTISNVLPLSPVNYSPIMSKILSNSLIASPLKTELAKPVSKFTSPILPIESVSSPISSMPSKSIFSSYPITELPIISQDVPQIVSQLSDSDIPVLNHFISQIMTPATPCSKSKFISPTILSPDFSLPDISTANFVSNPYSTLLSSIKKASSLSSDSKPLYSNNLKTVSAPVYDAVISSVNTISSPPITLSSLRTNISPYLTIVPEPLQMIPEPINVHYQLISPLQPAEVPNTPILSPVSSYTTTASSYSLPNSLPYLPALRPVSSQSIGSHFRTSFSSPPMYTSPIVPAISESTSPNILQTPLVSQSTQSQSNKIPVSGKYLSQIVTPISMPVSPLKSSLESLLSSSVNAQSFIEPLKITPFAPAMTPLNIPSSTTLPFSEIWSKIPQPILQITKAPLSTPTFIPISEIPTSATPILNESKYSPIISKLPSSFRLSTKAPLLEPISSLICSNSQPSLRVSDLPEISPISSIKPVTTYTSPSSLIPLKSQSVTPYLATTSPFITVSNPQQPYRPKWLPISPHSSTISSPVTALPSTPMIFPLQPPILDKTPILPMAAVAETNFVNPLPSSLPCTIPIKTALPINAPNYQLLPSAPTISSLNTPISSASSTLLSVSNDPHFFEPVYTTQFHTPCNSMSLKKVTSQVSPFVETITPIATKFANIPLKYASTIPTAKISPLDYSSMRALPTSLLTPISSSSFTSPITVPLSTYSSPASVTPLTTLPITPNTPSISHTYNTPISTSPLEYITPLSSSKANLDSVLTGITPQPAFTPISPPLQTPITNNFISTPTASKLKTLYPTPFITTPSQILPQRKFIEYINPQSQKLISNPFLTSPSSMPIVSTASPVVSPSQSLTSPLIPMSSLPLPKLQDSLIEVTSTPLSLYTSMQPKIIPPLSQYNTLPITTPSTQIPFIKAIPLEPCQLPAITPQDTKTHLSMSLSPIEPIKEQLLTPAPFPSVMRPNYVSSMPLKPFKSLVTPLPILKPSLAASNIPITLIASSSYPTISNNVFSPIVTSQVSPFSEYISQPTFLTPNYQLPTVSKVLNETNLPVYVTPSTNTPAFISPSTTSTFTPLSSTESPYTTTYYSPLLSTDSLKPCSQYSPFVPTQYTPSEPLLVTPIYSLPLTPALGLPTHPVTSKLPPRTKSTELPAAANVKPATYVTAPVRYHTYYNTPKNTVDSPVRPQFSPFASITYADTAPILYNSLSPIAPLIANAPSYVESIPATPLTSVKPLSYKTPISSFYTTAAVSQLSTPELSSLPVKTAIKTKTSSITSPTDQVMSVFPSITNNIEPTTSEYITPISLPPLKTATPTIIPQFLPLSNIKYITPKIQPYTPYSAPISTKVPIPSVTAESISPLFFSDYTPINTISSEVTPKLSPFSNIKYIQPLSTPISTKVVNVPVHLAPTVPLSSSMISPIISSSEQKSLVTPESIPTLALPCYTSQYQTPLKTIIPKLTPLFSPITPKYRTFSPFDEIGVRPISSKSAPVFTKSVVLLPISSEYIPITPLSYPTTEYVTPLNAISSKITPQISPCSYIEPYITPKILNTLITTKPIAPLSSSIYSPIVTNNIQPTLSEYITPYYSTQYQSITPKIKPQFTPFSNIKYVSPIMQPYIPYSAPVTSELNVPLTTKLIVPSNTVTPKLTPCSHIKHVSPYMGSYVPYISPISSSKVSSQFSPCSHVKNISPYMGTYIPYSTPISKFLNSPVNPESIAPYYSSPISSPKLSKLSPCPHINHISPYIGSNIPYSTPISKFLYSPVNPESIAPYYSSPISSPKLSKLSPCPHINHISPYIGSNIPYRTPISKFLNSPVTPESITPYYSSSISSPKLLQLSPCPHVKHISPYTGSYIPYSTPISKFLYSPVATESITPYTTEYITPINTINQKTTPYTSTLSNIKYITPILTNLLNSPSSKPYTTSILNALVTTEPLSPLSEYHTKIITDTAKIKPQTSPFTNISPNTQYSTPVNANPVAPLLTPLDSVTVPPEYVSPISIPDYTTLYSTPMKTVPQNIKPQLSPTLNNEYMSSSIQSYSVPVSTKGLSVSIPIQSIAPLLEPAQYVTPLNTVNPITAPQFTPFSNKQHISPVTLSYVSSEVSNSPSIPYITPISTKTLSTSTEPTISLSSESYTPTHTIAQTVTSPLSYTKYSSPVSSKLLNTMTTLSSPYYSTSISPIPTNSPILSDSLAPDYTTEYLTPSNTITQNTTPTIRPYISPILSKLNLPVTAKPITTYISPSIQPYSSTIKGLNVPMSPLESPTSPIELKSPYTTPIVPSYTTEYQTSLSTLSSKAASRFPSVSNMKHIPSNAQPYITPVSSEVLSSNVNTEHTTPYVTPLKILPFSKTEYISPISPYSTPISIKVPNPSMSTETISPDYTTEYTTPLNTVSPIVTLQESKYLNTKYISPNIPTYSTSIPTEVPNSALPVETILPYHSTEYTTPLNTVSPIVTPQASPFSKTKYISPSIPSYSTPVSIKVPNPSISAETISPDYTTEYTTSINTVYPIVTPQALPFSNTKYISPRIPSYSTPVSTTVPNLSISSEMILPDHTTVSPIVTPQTSPFSNAKYFSPSIQLNSAPISTKRINSPHSKLNTLYTTYISPVTAELMSRLSEPRYITEYQTPIKTPSTTKVSPQYSPFASTKYISPYIQPRPAYSTPISLTPVSAVPVTPLLTVNSPVTAYPTSPLSLQYPTTKYVTPLNTIAPKTNPFSYIRPCSYSILPKALNRPITPYYSTPISTKVLHPKLSPSSFPYSTAQNQIPLKTIPTITSQLSPFSNVEDASTNIEPYSIPVSPKKLNFPVNAKPIAPQYFTPIYTKLTPFSNIRYINNSYNPIKTLLNNMKPLKDDLKMSINNYINNNDDMKAKLFNSNTDLSISLGNIVLGKKESVNPKLSSINSAIGLKSWPSTLKLVEAKLELKFKDLSVTNFQPVVRDLNEYDVKEIENIVKNYIEKKYGNVIVANNNYTLCNEYEVVKNCCNVDSDRCNVLWPADTFSQWK